MEAAAEQIHWVANKGLGSHSGHTGDVQGNSENSEASWKVSWRGLNDVRVSPGQMLLNTRMNCQMENATRDVSFVEGTGQCEGSLTGEMLLNTRTNCQMENAARDISFVEGTEQREGLSPGKCC